MYLSLTNSLGTCRRHLTIHYLRAALAVVALCWLFGWRGAAQAVVVQSPTQTPTPLPAKPPLGISCDPNNPAPCESAFCTNNVCCDSDTCLEPERCDIFGNEGTCHPPLFEGAACEKHSDCEDPLTCRFDPISNQFVCAVPPQPTPTLIPYTPVPTPPGPIVCLCRSCGPGLCPETYFNNGASSVGCFPCLPPTACPGDCRGDGSVTVDEIVTMVHIAVLGVQPDCPTACGEPAATCSTCAAGDVIKDCEITVDEIVRAVNSALNGCPAEQTCGGISGEGCPSGEFCEFPQNTCAVADQTGECRPRPACDGTVAPVCGCDGQTYRNDCERALGGVARDHVGPCT